MELKIRADGGLNTGYGHWSRCIFLASCLDSSVRKILYTRNALEFDKFCLNGELKSYFLEDEQTFIDSVSSGDLVVLDGYQFNAEYVKLVKRKGALVMYIDDLIGVAPEVDVIVNHCPGITPNDFQHASAAVSFYLGGQYSLVSPDFKAHVRPAKGLNKLLIAMGGADPQNFTGKVILDNEQWLSRFDSIDIIVGHSNSRLEELAKLVEAIPRITFHNAISRHEVIELMHDAGVAILSASTMALEYAHIGGLLGVIETADNQKRLCQGLVKSGTALLMSDLVMADNNMADLYDRMLRAQRENFDGRSFERFKSIFSGLILQSQLTLRKAVLEDMERTFGWITDPDVRKFSFSKKEITWEEHKAWFINKIEQSNVIYLIGVIGGNQCGSIRFDVYQDETVISYLIDKTYRGKGLGKSLLVEGIKWLQDANVEINVLAGYVMNSNISSIRIFERMGFLKGDDFQAYPDSIRFYKKFHE